MLGREAAGQALSRVQTLRPLTFDLHWLRPAAHHLLRSPACAGLNHKVGPRASGERKAFLDHQRDQLSARSHGQGKRLLISSGSAENSPHFGKS